jgi:ERO1-like protein alpha
MICSFHTCTVCQCEENEIPLPWKQDSEFDDINKNIDEMFYQWVDKYNYTSSNWLVESEIDSRNGIYVNLEKNPESFTGYQGQHIWKSIYFENCFLDKFDQMCTEEKTLYKIISGLHANINVHLSRNYLNIAENTSYVNCTMLKDRVLDHPERMNNLFFLYSLLLKAFYKAEDVIRGYEYFTGNDSQDNFTKTMIDTLYNNSAGRNLCEECLKTEISYTYQCQDVDKFWDFNPNKLDQLKMKFRNISSIIDCVSCQKCKLHGKLQIYGLGTMFKILFSPLSQVHTINLKRNELIAFVNLVGKVSKAVKYIKEIENERIQKEMKLNKEEEMNKNFIKRMNKKINRILLTYFNNEDLEFIKVAFIFSLMFSLLIYLNIYFIRHKDQIVKKYETSYEDKLRRAKQQHLNKNKKMIYSTYEKKSESNENYLISSQKKNN